MVADYKRIKKEEIPLVAVLTDFAPHSYWIYPNINYYIVPSQGVKDRLIDKGVEPARIKPLGIPFDQEFNKNLDKIQIRNGLKIKEDLFTVLIMGGGHGLGPINKIVSALDSLRINLQLIVVCGSNQRLYNSLKRRLKSFNKKICLFAYSEKISELMSASDLIITKPGGVTCAEALAKRLPMVIISPIPGQEAGNTGYLTAHGAAVKTDRLRDLGEIITSLYKNRQRLKEISEAQAMISKPNASGDIARLLLEL